MRILFMHHFSLGELEAGRWVRHRAKALTAAGHEVRCFVVDGGASPDDPPGVARVTCRQGDSTADLDFETPWFSSSLAGGRHLSFLDLSDAQLQRYRDQMRRQLDVHVDRFDPHLIHGQHLWVQGQLALETGVPYVLNAWGGELIEYQADPRYRALAEQATENAARILVNSKPLQDRVVATFESAAEGTIVMPADLASHDSPTGREASVDWLLTMYRAVLAERFGQAPA
jgi:hypothetical protein